MKTHSSYPFICFDTEDNSKELMESGKSGFDKQVTQIAAKAANGDRYYNKGDGKAFLEWLGKRKERYFYAHNLQYDLGNLFSDKLDELDVTMVGGRLIKAVWGTKIFVDSYNIWPMSAKKLAPAFGLKKLETQDMAGDKEYVYQDVEIIWQAMTFAWQIMEGMGLKTLPPTLGGLCVKFWKHLGGRNCHDSHELSKQALFGGRVELFHICDNGTWQANQPEKIYSCFHGESPLSILTSGEGFGYYTDINSLYPAMMKKEYPAELEEWTNPGLPKYGIARCKVFQPETEIPVLPYREESGRILYPWGTMIGTWTVAELNQFEQLGGKILHIYESIGTNDSISPYCDFVDRLYQARLASKSEAERLFFKLLMNNLYGRLGTSGMIGRSVWQTDTNKNEGIPYGEKVLVNYNMPLGDEVNWSHAAYVTAYGRLELHKYLLTIGAERMIYCDTDSTIFNCQKGKLPFQCSSELGKMKLEGEITNAIAFAPKMYRVGKEYKAKGIPKTKAEQFINTGHAEFDLPYKLREAMRFFDRQNSKRLSVWRRVRKDRQTEYDRKKLIGNQFFPCKVNDS